MKNETKLKLFALVFFVGAFIIAAYLDAQTLTKINI